MFPMSRRQFSEPLSAVSCRQFPNLSIWLRTSWTNPSPSGDVQAASQCCFLTTLMPPLSVFSEYFFRLFSYLRANDKIFMSFLRFIMPLPLLLRSCDYCVWKSIADLLLLRGIYIPSVSESERCTGYDDSREQRYCCTVRLTICFSYFLIPIVVLVAPGSLCEIIRQRNR